MQHIYSFETQKRSGWTQFYLSLALFSELAAVLSLTNCEQAKYLDQKANERNVIHMSITNLGCSRIESPSTISVPLVNTPNALVQAVQDLR